MGADRAAGLPVPDEPARLAQEHRTRRHERQGGASEEEGEEQVEGLRRALHAGDRPAVSPRCAGPRTGLPQLQALQGQESRCDQAQVRHDVPQRADASP